MTIRLRSEEDIISAWEGGVVTPLVSVRCATYNHKLYIEEAIRSFLEQETRFPIEIIIHDDASTDGTTDIIKYYQKNYPTIIKSVLQKENQHSQGFKASHFINPLCRGKYYAICEGDDYWTDPKKLSKQVNFLEQHPELDLCIHPAIKVNMQTGEETVIGSYRENNGIVDAEEIIEKKYGQVPTASSLIRSTAYTSLNEFKKQATELVVGDIYLHFFGAMRGGAGYINEVMSCYRFMVPGSFVQRKKSSEAFRIKHLESRINGYISLDNFTSGKFSKSIQKSLQIFIADFLKSSSNSFFSRREVFKKYSCILDKKRFILLAPLSLIPFLLEFTRLVLKKN